MLANRFRPFQLAIAALLNLACTTALPGADSPSAGNAELFSRLDADHNGVVANDEVTSQSRSLFDRLLRKGDKNHDNALSRDEFIAALVPTRPEKPIEEKQPATDPGADAVRFLLLKLDSNSNARIEKDEVPKEFQSIFDIMLERLDTDKNDTLDRQELIRTGPGVGQLAVRYVQREGIDVKAELAKLEKAQGAAARRFDGQPMGFERLRDPQQARQTFKELDANNDGSIQPRELPEPLRERFERFISVADRDRDGRLSEREFLDGTERLSRFVNRQQKEERRDQKAMKAERKSAKSASADKN